MAPAGTGGGGKGPLRRSGVGVLMTAMSFRAENKPLKKAPAVSADANAGDRTIRFAQPASGEGDNRND